MTTTLSPPSASGGCSGWGNGEETGAASGGGIQSTAVGGRGCRRLKRRREARDDWTAAMERPTNGSLGN